MMPKITDDVFSNIINDKRDEFMLSMHDIIQILKDKVIELSERVARLEENQGSNWVQF